VLLIAPAAAGGRSRVAGPFTGTGADASLPFAFKVFETTDLVVTCIASGVETVLANGTDYTVTLNSDQDTSPGGAVEVLAAAFTLSDRPSMSRPMSKLCKALRLINQGGYYPKTIEYALDRVVAVMQQLTRSIPFFLPTGESTDWTLPRAASRLGKYLAFDASGDFVVSSGTGNDSALRTDLVAANGDVLVGSPIAGLSLAAFRQRWRRYQETAATVSQTARRIMSAGEGTVGNDVILAAQAGHAGPTMFKSLNGGVRLGELTLDGDALADLTSGWSGSGEQTSGLVYLKGTDATTRISGLRFSGVFKNSPNGAINGEYLENVHLDWMRLENVQTSGASYTVCAGLEAYYWRDLTAGPLVVDGFTKKGLSFSYLQRATFQSVRTKGGSVGQANIEFTGGESIFVGGMVHDGPGYGAKLWNVRRITFGPIIAYQAQEAAQVYGSHAEFLSIHSKDHVGSALQIDAELARTAPETSAEVDVVVHSFRSERGASVSTSANAITVRADATTSCPINRVVMQGVPYMRGGFSPAFTCRRTSARPTRSKCRISTSTILPPPAMSITAFSRTCGSAARSATRSKMA
jgi:hypothetical protein